MRIGSAQIAATSGLDSPSDHISVVFRVCEFVIIKYKNSIGRVHETYLVEHGMFNIRKGMLVGTILIPVALTGCASHLISSGLPDGSCAGGDCSVGQTSIFGRAGISSNAASGGIPEECGGRGFTRVEVRRSFGQGFATVLTLGALNPATLHFSCKKAGPENAIVCNLVPGVPDVMECAQQATGTEPEACSTLPSFWCHY